jgi:hypothetical protein
MLDGHERAALCGVEVQDRYFGDIGDFAKFGLLRGLLTAVPQFRLGILWYRVPDESHTKDGRHIDYLLKPTDKNSRQLRDCDPELYDKLRYLVVEADQRTVSVVRESALLPSNTIYHDQPFSYQGISRSDRPAHRRRWLAEALDAMAPATVIFADPDNGLEVGTDRYNSKGPKFIFYDDLVRLFHEDKTLVSYQHANRDGSFPQQIRSRLAALRRQAFDRPVVAFTAVRWRRVSARAFLLVLGNGHREKLRERLERFLAGPWGAHFEEVRL